MDFKNENSKNKKTSNDENKSMVSKIKVVPLEKLRTPKNSKCFGICLLTLDLNFENISRYITYSYKT